jgi:lipopolysaccharide/colanic/teichoic acid biosynthesis glycosyltransferase
MKRALDVVVVAVSIAVLAPVIAVVAVLVAITTGRPVLFKQVRLGRNGRSFTLLKFRTMSEARDSGGNLLPDGDRITRTGRVLRQWSLDELPTLVNVLRGEMSLVGPRPLLPEYWALYSSEQRRRHELPPGIAGPVPAYGRNSLSWADKFALDVWYVDNWSLRLDAKIFSRTLWKAITREGVSADGHATMPRFEGESPNRKVLE